MFEMSQYLCLVLTLAHIVYGACPGGCNRPEAIYDELKCIPVYKKPNDCCPIKYDCSVLDHNPVDKCVLNGKFYSNGQKIPEGETYPSCRIDCYCRFSPYNFDCASLDCPEYLGSRAKPGCHFKYELDQCCNVGEVCPPLKNINCTVGGETKLEGEKFRPPNQNCISCVCKEGFNGNFVAPFCKKYSCVEELRNSYKIANYCAMVFFPDSCCPYEWICPNGNDKIISTQQGNSDKDLQCNYGKNKLLNVGDKFVRDGVPCECKVPPFVTCLKEY